MLRKLDCASRSNTGVEDQLHIFHFENPKKEDQVETTQKTKRQSSYCLQKVTWVLVTECFILGKMVE